MADEKTIDSLQIEIEANASDSLDGLEELSKKLRELKASVSGSYGDLASVARELAGINAVSEKMKSALSGISAFTKEMKKMRDLSGMSLPTQQLREFSSAARSMNNASAQAQGLKALSSGMNSYRNAAEKLAGIDTHIINEIIQMIGKSAQSVGNMSEQAGYLKEFAKGINSFTAGMRKLQAVRLEDLDEKIKAITAAIKPLTDEMIRAGAGISNFGEQMKYLAQAANTANKVQKQMGYQQNNKNLGIIAGGFKLANFGAVLYMTKRVARGIAGMIDNINTYIEDINLFTVAMGEFAEEGRKFAQNMQDVLGIDAGETMRNMGLFMQLSTAFGMASDQAYILSKNLTQLGLDISSFYNISIEDSFLKLRSSLVGEIEPIRALGVDLSQTRLQLELTNLGIKASFNNLTQADKALLRYRVILQQTTSAQGKKLPLMKAEAA